MESAYSIDGEREIAERAEVVIRGLASGAVSDGDAFKVLRAARLFATRAISMFSAGTVNKARLGIAVAALDLIEALKGHGSRDQRIQTAMRAIDAWKRELAVPMPPPVI